MYGLEQDADQRLADGRRKHFQWKVVCSMVGLADGINCVSTARRWGHKGALETLFSKKERKRERKEGQAG